MSFSEALKLKIKRKAHFSCCLCHNLGVEVHHIIPQSEAGPDDEDNAAPLCPSCHEIYGANAVRRKFIRETRDFWYEVCSKRFATDSDRVDEIKGVLQKMVSKDEFDSAIQKLEEVIRAHDSRKTDTFTEAELQELTSALESLLFARKAGSVLHFQRKVHLIRAVCGLPTEMQEKWFALARVAQENGTDALWMEEIANQSLSGTLEKQIAHQSAMPTGKFVEYLNYLSTEHIKSVAREADIPLEGLSTADAEWIQANQAPPHLLEEWRNASEDRRPLLMADWISQGKVRRINFGPGKQPGAETPGYYHMRRGRQLMLGGKKLEAFELIKAAFILDPIAAEGFALWLGNPLIEESAHLMSDPDVFAFVTELYGPEQASLIRNARQRSS